LEKYKDLPKKQKINKKIAEIVHKLEEKGK
jgi:hypothetical protein